jgi:hypothetical protein
MNSCSLRLDRTKLFEIEEIEEEVEENEEVFSMEELESMHKEV